MPSLVPSRRSPPAALLAYSTTYTATVTTAATNLAGNALAANFVWTFTTRAAPDTTPPIVISTIPASAATGVARNQVLSAAFSKAMNCATLTSPATTFTVTGPSAAVVAGTVNCTGSVATFTPAALLAANTLFTARVTTGAADLAGNALANDYVWSFLTAPAPTPTLPSVISAVPANGATGVAINHALSATFSEAMNLATINSASFTVTGPGGVAVAGAVTYIAAGSVATFTPAAPLAYSTTYTATVTTAATNLAGNALAANFVWTFTTRAAPDTTPPIVISTIPASAATGVARNQVLSAAFSKAMNCATLTSPATTFTVTGPSAAVVAGTVNCTGSVATFTPAALLATNTLFTARVTTGAADLAGNALANDYVWSFITAPAPTPHVTKRHLCRARQWSHRRGHQPRAQCNLQRGHELRHDQQCELHRDRAGRSCRSRSGHLCRRWFGRDVYTSGEPGIPHRIYRHGDHRGQGPGGQCAGQ